MNSATLPEIKPENLLIMVVDDDPLIRSLLKIIVEQQGIRAVEASGGKEALTLFEKNEPDIVITDLSMPEMDGLTLSQKLHEKKPQLPIIVITGFADKEIAVNVLRSGAYDILEKPFEPDDIILTLSRAVDKIRLERALADNIENLKKAESELESARSHLTEDIAQKTTQLLQTNRELEEKIADVEGAISTLKKFDQQKTEFIAIASHELRTPLAVIKAVLSNLMAGIKGPLSPEQLTTLQSIDLDIDRFSRTINELLNLSRIESGQFSMYREPTSLQNLLSKVIEALKETAVRKKITIATNLAENLPALFCDRDKTTQIFVNILDNAVKYTQEEGRVAISASLINDHIKVKFADNGPGIPADQLPIIFEKFKKVATTSKKMEGLGLGLAIAKEFVTLQGGEISVQSKPGEGTIFTILLPSILSAKTTETVPLKKVA